MWRVPNIYKKKKKSIQSYKDAIRKKKIALLSLRVQENKAQNRGFDACIDAHDLFRCFKCSLGTKI